MSKKVALVTGVTGQDGSYLAEFLLKHDYSVVGLVRRSSNLNTDRISSILNVPEFKLEEFDLTDPVSCSGMVQKYKPDEFYNLAAQSHVGTSFSQPNLTFNVNTLGVVNILESIRVFSPATRFYQASTSEMFGYNFSINTNGLKFQNEETPMFPQSPYGAAKLASHNLVRIYRSSYNIYGSCGILFNHESPRRGTNFVTRKITRYIGQLMNGKTHEKLSLGNLSAKRDWGHAKDYVKAMYLMLQAENPDDYVVSTGETYSVEEFLIKAFGVINLNWKDYVIIDPNLYRPSEVDYLNGDSSKTRKLLNWYPEYTFDQLVEEMVKSDIENECI
jgi:GDPmannose 4,6-dehydratase